MMLAGDTFTWHDTISGSVETALKERQAVQAFDGADAPNDEPDNGALYFLLPQGCCLHPAAFAHGLCIVSCICSWPLRTF